MTDLVIKSSPFANTYGGLDLVQRYDDPTNLYMRMRDRAIDDWFGPLTEKQVAAFYLLCELADTEK